MGTRNFQWDPIDDCVMQETDQSGNTLVTYTHEPGQFGPLLSENRGGTESYHHYDALGSTTMLTNDAGTVTDTFQYDAWGKSVATTGTTPSPYLWVGKWGYQFDSATDAYYIRARSYQPQIARWMSVDPLALTNFDIARQEGLTYQFTRCSPTFLLDPSGLLCIVCNQTVYFRGYSVFDLDELVVGGSFSALAKVAAARDFNSGLLGTNKGAFDFPEGGNTFLQTGPQWYPNIKDIDPGDGLGLYLPNGIIAGFNLFFVVFEVIENPEGSCRIFLNEIGTKDTEWTNKPKERIYDRGFGKDSGDIRFRNDVKVDKLTRPKQCCDKALIYVDAPGNYATFRPVRDIWFENDVKQRIVIRELGAPPNSSPLASQNNSVVIGVDKNRGHVASESGSGF